MPKLKILTGVIMLVCAACFFSNCSKNKQKEFVEMDIDSAVHARFDFKVGTYWIYRDSLNGRTDSFYVRSNEYVPQEETYNIYNYHYITIAEVNIDGSNPGDSANWVFNFQATNIMMEYHYTPFSYGWQNQIQFFPLFLYPYSFGDQVAKNDSASVTKIDSFYSVNLLRFYRVAHVYHFSAEGASTLVVNKTRLTDWFFVNDSVGMIRMQLEHPDHNIHRDWRLVRYNIVK